MSDKNVPQHQTFSMDHVSARDSTGTMQMEGTHFAVRGGPLPPAEDLARYNVCVQNGAERIMRMTEIQSEHRREMEKKIIQARISLANRGQFFAFVLGLVGLGGGFAAVWFGHDWAGTVLAGGSLVALVTAFLKYNKTEDAP